MYEAKIIADSVSRLGCRLTTFEVTYPLIIHAEVMTHRVFSRNVASNRAIPVKKLIASVQESPFIPDQFPKNQAGMQSSEWLGGEDVDVARDEWLVARDCAVEQATRLMNVGVHKQIANRLLAPFLWTTAVISATDWNNFFSLRCHPAAQPEIQKLAYMMRHVYETSEPKLLGKGDWHLPYITKETEEIMNKLCDDGYIGDLLANKRLVSIGRCARVSYLTHGSDTSPMDDIVLAEKLIEARHMSPTEHVATPTDSTDYCGNFSGWMQYRKTIAGESGK